LGFFSRRVRSLSLSCSSTKPPFSLSPIVSGEKKLKKAEKTGGKETTSTFVSRGRKKQKKKKKGKKPHKTGEKETRPRVPPIVFVASVALSLAAAGAACALREILCPPRRRGGVLVIDYSAGEAPSSSGAAACSPSSAEP
jgi:hypothetical protein